MTYRAQQLLALGGLTLVASLASTASLYSLAKRHFYDEYRAKLLSIAATAAALTDAGKLLEAYAERILNLREEIPFQILLVID